ncbi:caspase-3-like [Branchiostoma floridae]|uniref:Caspase-3-like n=1 Tax=Branchiostoma floridae TaxID=7739 RepID=A0A9J7M6Y3_BRAFL|nr:caspase-3-like [Branchiostoma floridae]
MLEGTLLQMRGLSSTFSLTGNVESLQKKLVQLNKLVYIQSELNADLRAGHKATRQSLISKEQHLQTVTTENAQLKTELTREKQARGCSFDLCRRLEEENGRLMDRTEADKREIERLKDQVASLSNGMTCTYEMSHVPRGIAIIINNIHFEDMGIRDGAEGDTGRLREAFESLGFTVVTLSDLDHAKMVAAMKDQGKADHSNHDCFVCCVMSHGTMGKVFSSDDVGIDICELMKPVNAKKCPSLKGKPKLFFIQACQGEKSQCRESFDGDRDAKPVPFICHEADFFLGLATVPGYVARRDQDGAPYVHHLANMLKDFGPTHDLSAIMAMVCDKMNDIHDDKFGWISSNHSTLRKKIIFNTK